MRFEDLARQPMRHGDESVNYMLVYHGDETWVPRFKSGAIMTIEANHVDYWSSSVTLFKYECNGVPADIRCASTEDRFVVTTKMKKDIVSSVYVKCFYPLDVGSPFYSDEDLFEAKLSGDYEAIRKTLRKEFNAWKKVN